MPNLFLDTHLENSGKGNGGIETCIISLRTCSTLVLYPLLIIGETEVAEELKTRLPKSVQ